MKRSVLFLVLSFSFRIALAQVTVGSPVPEISLPATNDSIVSLSSLKGKVVLIDFWASWCVPCRASIPAVVKLYKKYKDKGFEVFGVSIDKKKSAWLKAIRQEHITYKQVNDDAGWDGKSTAAYGVNEIPTTFLLDKEGKLVAIDLEGSALETKLKELLGLTVASN